MNRENKPNAQFCVMNLQSLNLAHKVTSMTLRRRVGSWALMKDEDGSYSLRVDDEDDADDEDDEDNEDEDDDEKKALDTY